MSEKTNKWPKLDTAFKKKWLRALRSGSYKGATGELCKIKKDGEPKGYCCLGVAGHIQGIPIKKLEGGTFLTSAVIKGYGKSIPKQLKGSGKLPSKLANMNDNKHGFKRIADWIEKNL